MPTDPFIDLKMNCETTNKNDETSETSETSKGDTEKEKLRKFLYAMLKPNSAQERQTDSRTEI